MTVTISIDPLRTIAQVDDRIYSGFVEHLGRCIYGGLVPVNGTTDSLITPSGFRADVLQLLRDELKVPMVRWPGGNFVSSYRWQDGIGPKEKRPRRPELAWGAVESNQFGTDEFLAWCKEAQVEPYICLNMGTGTLEDALAWLEYVNGTGDTYWANLRRQNTGRNEAYGVKLWGLGNEMWGEWQIGQLTAQEYATKAAQWAHALKLLDSTIQLISCGETGVSSWDHVVLQKLAKWVDWHSIHLYTSPGPDGGENGYEKNVFGPAAAERSLDVVKGLIDLARIEQKVTKPIKIAFDEWNVWDFTKGTPQNGLEQRYDLSDALGVASWLNIFIRKSDLVTIACIAQSVNVISPIITSPTGHYLQTIYHPLYLFATYMRGGVSLDVRLTDVPVYSGPTFPTWTGGLQIADSHEGLPYLDASAVLVANKSLRIAVVNRHPTKEIVGKLRVAGPDPAALTARVIKRFEVYGKEVTSTNSFESPNAVTVVETEAQWQESVVFKEHSFTLLVFDL